MKGLPVLLFCSLFFVVCSEAPLVELSEAKDRVVLAELFTEDG